MNCMASRMRRRNSHGRFPPIQCREACVVAIKDDPGTAVLEGQGGEPGVGYPRPSCSPHAQAREDPPMPLAGLHDFAVRLVPDVVAAGQGFADLTGMFEDPGIWS